MNTYEVDYFNDCHATRTTRIQAETEAELPAKIKKQDRAFTSVKRVKIVQQRGA